MDLTTLYDIDSIDNMFDRIKKKKYYNLRTVNME